MCSLLTVIIFIQYNTIQAIPVPSLLHFDAMKREKRIRLISLSLMVECVSYTNTYACVFVCLCAMREAWVGKKSIVPFVDYMSITMSTYLLVYRFPFYLIAHSIE